MKFLWIDSRDQLYDEWLALRHRILREPLGLSISPDDLATEKDQRHLIAVGDNVKDNVEGNSLLGGLVVVPLDNFSWKIRQVAVDERFRRRGIGKQLMGAAEAFARKAGIQTLSLNSREKVISFYEQLGYCGVGESFIEVGIPHQKMIREIE